MDLETYVKKQKRLEEYTKSFYDADTYWMDYPTIRDLARRYKCKQTDIEDMITDSEVLNYSVGMRCESGHGLFDRMGDYVVEWMGE